MKTKIERSKELINVERRLFLRHSLSLGALSLLAGCDLTGQESVQRVLMNMSRWNDGVQHWLFDPNRLAPEFPESRITRPFPYNGYYPEEEVREMMKAFKEAASGATPPGGAPSIDEAAAREVDEALAGPQANDFDNLGRARAREQRETEAERRLAELKRRMGK